MAHGVWPWCAQLQQRDVVVVVAAVVELVHHDPPDRGHELGTALHLHAQVGTPCSGVSQPGWEQTKVVSLKSTSKHPLTAQVEKGEDIHAVQTLEPKGTCGFWPCLGQI